MEDFNMVENVKASNRFKDMDSEYYATIKITPATYGYIHTNSVIAKILSSRFVER